jgi:hypothetical protein
MLKTIDSILIQFRPCFSRQAAFHWFVVIITGLMLRSDHLGVTSIIRDLALNPRCYETLIHFFRSSAWSLDALRVAWVQVVHRMAPVFYINEMAVLVGDGVKQAKEAKASLTCNTLHMVFMLYFVL